MLSVVLCSLSSTASKPNECISDVWSAVMLVRGDITCMQVEMSFSVRLIDRLVRANTVNIIL